MAILPVTALPRHLLVKCFLLDNVPSIAVQAEPRVSYASWIPDAHYPHDEVTRLPLLVAIHGSHREDHRCLNLWKDFANEHKCAVVAPLFPAMIQGPLDGEGYHYLGRAPAMGGMLAKAIAAKSVATDSPIAGLDDTSIRYDRVLLHILDEVSIRWPAIETSRIFLTGYSGGGQFVHRFAYFHADRLAALSVGAPGAVTKLDPSTPWPLGTGGMEDVFGGDLVNIDALRKVPILAVVGGEDIGSEVAELSNVLKGSQSGSVEDGPRSRIALLESLAQNWRDNGIGVKFVVVPGVGHNMEGVNGPVSDFMTEHIDAWWAARQ
ncbi:hypothetical protein LTR36_006450 [Oleoguttula mirabilis]|uniref:Carboxylic ester hydrolase n=1 Tax=Oleoguttula mirabilis TaxID=1507867 RepID=A0AAV9JV30_9PEZI|nr:hypothetical protein LTR36_006450 [Oleoguttula mirabilis]